MKVVTLETIYEKIVELQHEVVQIKKNLLEYPELRSDFILRMKGIDTEKSVMVDDFRFAERYGDHHDNVYES